MPQIFFHSSILYLITVYHNIVHSAFSFTLNSMSSVYLTANTQDFYSSCTNIGYSFSNDIVTFTCLSLGVYYIIGAYVCLQEAVKADSAQYLIGSERRRHPMGRWWSGLTPISWETAGTGYMRTETTERAMEIQWHCRLAGVDSPWMEWMRTCMSGPGKETCCISLKVDQHRQIM